MRARNLSRLSIGEILLGLLALCISGVAISATPAGPGLASNVHSRVQPAHVILGDQESASISTGSDSVTRREVSESVPAERGISGSRTYYFTPMDEVSSVTCMFFYNTTSVDANVSLQAFQLNGDIEIDTTIPIPDGDTVRVCSDTVDGTSAASWQDTSVINFRTFSVYGRVTLPDGVGVEAYVAWNGRSTYYPLDPVPTMGLRFLESLSEPVTLHFTPQDENANVTCLFLYNTATSNADVQLQTFRLNGDPYIADTIPVPAGHAVRVCSDLVDSSGAASWEGTILVNLRTYSARARMVLPAGVLVEGYVAWNNDTIYDPNAAVPVFPLTFMTSSSEIFGDRFQALQ